MKITFRYSADARKNYFIQNGKQLSNEGELEYDPETLTPEQRELIYGQENLVWHNGSNQTCFNYPCTIADILAYLRQEQLEADLKLAKEIEAALKVVEEWSAKTAMEIVSQNSYQLSRWHQEIRYYSYNRAKELLNSKLSHPLVDDVTSEKIAEIDRAIAEAKELRKAMDGEAKAKEERDEDLRIAQVEAEKQRKREEMADWIERYGDEQLQLAHANGYKCHRLYASQRAALEYPGFILDFNDKSTWNERVSPSLTALKQLGAYPNTNAEIVWITGLGDDEEAIDEFECFEAIVISKYLGKYDLILPIAEGGPKAIEQTSDSIE